MAKRFSAIKDIIRRLTGADLDASREFLLNDCYVRGKGFWSQYAGQGTISCTTSAICIYALAQSGRIKEPLKREFENILLGFRKTVPAQHHGAFPRTTGAAEGEPSTWTTAQVVLALSSLGTSWQVIRPSVEWLIAVQSANGGWNFPGTTEGNERLIYSFYPTLILLRFRNRLKRCNAALSRVAGFAGSCEERYDAFWVPLLRRLQRLLDLSSRRDDGSASLQDYWRLFESGWPTYHVDDDWLPKRFSMALMCGPNYLLLRGQVAPNDPLAMLHLRYFADERRGSGWNDKAEKKPKTWATALGVLTLYYWAKDVQATESTVPRLPTRVELISRSLHRLEPPQRTSKTASDLLRRFQRLRPGNEDFKPYQHLIQDVFTYLFGDVLKDPKPESKTLFGTLRRDVTFRNAADKGPWADWKIEHHALHVVVECKNERAVSNDDVRQIASYLGKGMGQLGVLASRNTSADEIRELLNAFVYNDDKYVLVVNDAALIDWIRLKDRGEDPTDAIADLYRSLRERSQ